MAEFIEIKKVLASLLRCNKDEIDDNCDIAFSSTLDEKKDKTCLNSSLRNAHTKSAQYSYEHMEMISSNYREKALSSSRYLYRFFEDGPIVDEVNGIEYTIGPATEEYCFWVLNELADFKETSDYRIRSSFSLMMRMRRFEFANANDVKLSEVLQLYTIKVRCNNSTSKEKIRGLSAAFRFDFSYRTNVPMIEYFDICEAFLYERPLRKERSSAIEHGPMRIYNADVLEYYEVGIETKDPFTQYISFYHIVEHFYDEIFKKKIIEKFQKEITSPDFSYKNEQKIYTLAKNMHQAMRNDESIGKGNEFDSLKYVLIEYVPVDKLRERIKQFDSSSEDFFQNQTVAFANVEKTKIAWNNPDGVYTNLASRIYETRNALVHSKSEQAKKRYNPHKDRRNLLKEVILIQAVAELVIINSSKMI